jgi:7-carboxy-7-deazaguanine synthase
MNQLCDRLRITEIFCSIQGESDSIGWPTVFIRLTGCPLRCQYCDTSYAFQGGKIQALEEILATVKIFSCARICVTGGEPLAQPGCFKLLSTLCDLGYAVSLETSGARDISLVDSRVVIVMDIKTPDSKECDKNLWENIDYIKAKDQLKFVLCSRQDYIWSINIIKEHNLSEKTQVLFSPSWGQLDPTELADWIIQDKLNVRFQMQLHKILWNDEPGR